MRIIHVRNRECRLHLVEEKEDALGPRAAVCRGQTNLQDTQTAQVRTSRMYKVYCPARHVNNGQ